MVIGQTHVKENIYIYSQTSKLKVDPLEKNKRKNETKNERKNEKKRMKERQKIEKETNFP